MRGHHSVVLRFAVGAIAAALLVVGGVFLFTYQSMVPLLVEDDARITMRDLEVLQSRFQESGVYGVAAAIEELARRPGNAVGVYLLTRPGSEGRIAGNLDGWPQDVAPHQQWSIRRVRMRDGVRRPAGVATVLLPDNTWLLVGRALPEYQAFRNRIFEGFALCVVSLVLIGTVGGLLFYQALVRRIGAIAESADEIVRGDRSRRLPVREHGHEFESLVDCVNQLLSRVDQLINSTRSATDSMAHDFRSPLARLKTRLEMQLTSPRSEAELRDTLATALAEIDTILHTLNVLLQIARAEGDLFRDQWTSIDLNELAQDLGELYRPLAEEDGLELAIETWQAPLVIRGHGALLAQAVSNLIENAIKYSVAPGTVTLRTASDPAGAWISVADHGPGIAPGQHEHVLKRFVRLDEARSTPGAGLGLSLVQAVAKQHSAVLSFHDNDPGLRVVLRFPPRERRTSRFLRQRIAT